MRGVNSDLWLAVPAQIVRLCRQRELLLNLTARDLKVRYKQSLLGGVWAVVQPLSLMVVFSAVFSLFIKVQTPGIPYPIFSYVALVPWTYFANTMSIGVGSLVANANMVAKIYFPREIFPLASLLAGFVDFIVAATIFVGLLLWYRISLSMEILWLPLIVFVQVALMFGLLLVLSAANVFYRDVRLLLPFLLQLWLYLTPVIYPLTVIPARYRALFYLNPMTGIIDSYRRVLVLGIPPSPGLLAITLPLAFLLLVGGYVFFKRVEMLFADVI